MTRPGRPVRGIANGADGHAAAGAARARVLTTALCEAAQRLDLGQGALRDIIGISQPTASRLFKGDYQLAESGKSWELATHLLRLYRSLSSLVGGSDELARAWLRSANRAFDDRPPLELIRRVDGLIHVCEYLDAHRARV